MNLHPDETDLRGRWLVKEGRVEGDTVCERIEELIRRVLTKLGNDPSGWDTLYQDPRDGRLWERTYPQGELHGGGPPRLTVISEADARVKYDFA
jgi:hypothetical protein